MTLLVSLGVLTFFMVWDFDSTFKHWSDRFFASEKKLGESSSDGTTLVHYNVGNWIYLGILVLMFLVNLAIIIPGLSVVLRRRCRSTTKKVNTMREMPEKPSVEAIVPCYLPNECEIIEETVWHILEHVESPGAFKLWVVYNTPKDMPDIEGRLQAIAERSDLPHGRTLEVVRAVGSKSKAENINLLLPRIQSDYTIVYDADHHPDPESLMLLVEKSIRRNLACAQGSTYIRDLKSGFVARMIDAEFFVTHFVYFPIMRLLTRNAVFCGSNGLWRTEVLQTTTFDPSMQTEDIDVSVKMLLENHSIDFCPEARSGELAPVSLRALYKQRSRWAIGWDEVSLKLMQKLRKSDAQGTRKAALAYICWSRWLMQAIGLIAGVATPLLSLVQRIDPDLCHCGTATQFLQTCMFYFYLTLVAGCILEAACQTHHRRFQSWIQVIFVALFMAAGFFYILFQAVLIAVSLFKISTGTVGGWVVTARNVQKPVQQKTEAAPDATAAAAAQKECDAVSDVSTAEDSTGAQAKSDVQSSEAVTPEAAVVVSI